MYRLFLKRLLDIIISLILLLLFFPLMCIIAVCIKITSKGPVFFRQSRAGYSEKYFNILKFRSMSLKKKDDKTEFDAGSDLRVTAIGRILRKTKLDELPQLFNVIKGDMSLVGPRPEVQTYIKLYPLEWKQILTVKPGITDPASIEFRNEEEILAAANDPENEYRQNILPTKLKYYKDYVENISFFFDLKIVLKTVFVVLFS
jgi:lipopolysaccharide/colanic/teichoic acid biosynthesis glycosyltransferase